MIRLRVLGAPDLRGADGAEVRSVLAQPKRLGLLTYLAVNTPTGFHRRDSLLALFWPEADDAHARNALRQAIHHLRQALGEGVLVGRGTEELALAGERLWCDAVAFVRALAGGDLIAGLETYRGDLLPGFHLSDAPEFERWLEGQRAGLRARAAEAAWTLAEREAAAEHATSATHWARWAAGLAPEDEAVQRRLIALLLRLGDRAGALRAYDTLATRLAQDYDAAPAAETSKLVSTLRASPVPVAPPAIAPGLQEPLAQRPPRARSRWIIAAAALGAGVILTVLVRNLRPGTPSTGAEAAVAVMPFPVRGRADLGYLREGMVDLVSAKLDGMPDLRSIDPRAVLAAVRADTAAALDPAEAGRVAGRLGADWYVLGDVVEVAGRLQVTAALFDRQRGSAPVVHATAEGDATRVFALTSELAAQLLANIGHGRDTTLTSQAGFSTRSLPALKSYLEGERAFRAGHYLEAQEAFQRAVTSDTAFALAYYRLAVTADWAGNTLLVGAAADRAIRRMDRLSALAQNLLAAFRLYAAADADRAEWVYRAVATTHPDNLEAAYMLGEVQFHFNPQRGRSFTEAREAFERVLALEPGDGPALVHLARIAAAEGRQAELDSLTQRYLRLHPQADRALEMRGLRAFAQDDPRARARVLAELTRGSNVDLDIATGNTAVFDADLAGAARLVQLYFAPGRGPGYILRGHSNLAQIEAARGRLGAAEAEARVLLVEDWDWSLELWTHLATLSFTGSGEAELRRVQDALAGWHPTPQPTEYFSFEHRSELPELRAYLVGLVAARLGDSVAARRSAAELDRFASTGADSGVARDLAAVVRAEAAERRGAPGEALRQVERFRFDPHTRTNRKLYEVSGRARFLRAEALHVLGRDEEALRWYASFPDPNGQDLAFLAPARRRTAEIAAHLGRGADAVRQYARFVALWQAADPELQPDVQRAAAALARLRPLTDSATHP